MPARSSKQSSPNCSSNGVPKACRTAVEASVADNPIDFFNRENRAIRNATAHDLLRVARTYLQPHNLYIAIAGDKTVQ